jgi:hypothetical protein
MWTVNAATSVFLLVLLAVRKNYRNYPAFTVYICANLALGISLFILYRRWGFSSRASWLFAWGMQVLVICARALAVVEICKHFLVRYPGIWALARRILLGCAGLVLLYSGLAARHQWKLALPSADRGLELSIAAVIVILFLFARFYEVRPERTDRSMAIGFCLYSCFRALNDTILERYLYGYATLWSLLGTLAFLASLLLWTWALRKPQSEAVAEEALLPAGIYQAIAPQINLRLRLLNEQLSQFWKAEGVRR